MFTAASPLITHTAAPAPAGVRSPSAAAVKERSNALLKGRGRRSPPGLRPCTSVMATADVVEQVC